MMLQNISCFLMLLPHEVSEMSYHFVLTTKTTQPCPQVFSVDCPVFCQLCCRIAIIFPGHLILRDHAISHKDLKSHVIVQFEENRIIR